MRTDEFPFYADWFAISLRWMSLLGVSFALSITGTRTLGLTLVVILSILWNIICIWLAVMYRRLPGHRVWNIVIDTIVSLALFSMSGGLNGAIPWVGALAIVSGAVYYEWRGALSAALVLSLFEGAWTYLTVPDIYVNLPWLGIMTGVNFILAPVFTLPSKLLIKGVRRRYQGQVSQRRESEKRAQKSEHVRMSAFYKMIETLSATLNYQVVVDTVLELCQSILKTNAPNAELLAGAVMLFSEHNLEVKSARRFSPTDMRRTFPAEKGILNAALKTGEPQKCGDPIDDPELRGLLGIQSMKSVLCLPLLRGLDAYGVMLFAHPEENFFNQERIELLEMIGHQSVISIQNARLFQALDEEKARMVESMEEANKKLARNLHDGPTQSVSAIAMRVNIVRKMLEVRPEEVPQELERIEDLARRTTQEIRHMLFTLRPLVLENEGLLAALKAMAEKMHDTYQQKVTVDADETTISRFDQSRQTVVFYLAEEAVNNARKHAKAAEIRIRIRFADPEQTIALLEIIDNGLGFKVDEVLASYDRRGSLGMINLKERTELVSGLLDIQSVPGRGTRVQVYIPLSEEAADRLQRGLFTRSTGQG